MKDYFKHEEIYHIIPICLIVLIIPLIVYLKVVPLDSETIRFWTGQKESLDFFSYYKSLWLLILTCGAILLFLLKCIQDRFQFVKKTYYYLGIIVYSILVVISSILSQYKHISMFGFAERYEGMFILLSYMVILFITINLAIKEKHIKLILSSIFVCTAIISIIGIFQYFGLDFFKSGLGKDLMLPTQFKSLSNKLEFQFGKNTIYSTLYNTNYVGSYMAMILPLTSVTFLLVKNRYLKISMILLSLLVFMNLLGSNSRAGIVGVVISLGIVLILIIKNKKIVFDKKKISVGIFAICFLAVILNLSGRGSLFTQFKLLFNDIKAVSVSSDTPSKSNNIIQIQDIIIKDNTCEIITNEVKLTFQSIDGNLAFFDNKDKPLNIKIKSDGSTFFFENSTYKGYEFDIKDSSDKKILKIKKNILQLYFLVSNNTISMVDNIGQAVTFNKNVSHWGFEGKEKIGSSRGYIWSRSIPLIKNTIIKGYGPDTFSIYFPQNDFNGKLKVFENMWLLVDKPHNLYIQTAINTGLISLVAILSMFVAYIISSIKIYKQTNYDNFLSVIGLGIFTSVIGYLITGFFNDSVVSVAPIFWIIFGLGISINYMIKDKLLNN